MSRENVFERFISIHPNIKPAVVWLCSSNYSCLSASKIVSKIWTDVSQKVARVCKFCECIYTDFYSHILTLYPLTQSIRNDFLENVFLNYKQIIYDKLINSESEDILRCLIGQHLLELNNEQCHIQFCQQSYKYIAACINLHV